MRSIRRLATSLVLAAFIALSLALPAFGAGTLTPVGSTDAPIRTLDHHVEVVINNGFAQTRVSQTFHNPNDRDLEALYAFPVPKSASLSEVVIHAGEKVIHGEVVETGRARKLYEEERSRGNDAGLATKNGYQTYEFRVSPVRANADTRMEFVYYQPLEIDTGVGRYLYPLEEGGTDEATEAFWFSNDRVEGTFSLDLELKSAWPVTNVRMPGFEDAAVDRLETGHYRIHAERQGATLANDFVFYYRLQDGLPGRVEVVAYRPDERSDGTFMAVVTPGIDLEPLSHGRDYAFVLDVSGSMGGAKIATLGRAVIDSIRAFDPADRFRVITFSNGARELTRGWVTASSSEAEDVLRRLAGLQAGGSTNVYAGLKRAVDSLDDDRATSIVLVTDAVTNTGIVDPKDFHDLLRRYDVRVFGFLIGNSSNWPLMRTVADASGGFYAAVSNADDMTGQIALAKSKMSHEALHDAELEIGGVETSDRTGEIVGKVYRGQQLVLFGRYHDGGRARLSLEATLTGEDKTYSTRFEFPDVDTDNPELERLWAMSMIEELEHRADLGLADAGEVEATVRQLGVDYQLVTDHTSMVVLDDAAFARHGVERRNRKRVAVEHAAQARRAQQPPRNHRVDREEPAFRLPVPDLGGGGAVDPFSALLALGLTGGAAWASRRERPRS